MQAEEILNRLHAMAVDWFREFPNDATHVLLDPRTRLALFRYNTAGSINPVNYVNNTVFGYAIIEVYKPYPFIALAKVNINDA